MNQLRNFKAIQRELGLVPFVESRWGNLYCVPVAPGAPRLIVRHFDGELSVGLIPTHCDLTVAAQLWVERHAALSALVSVSQPSEAGTDFIARSHYLGDSLARFADGEDPPEPPDELLSMQRHFAALSHLAAEPRDALIAEVLARSILLPSTKTFYSYDDESFHIAELSPTREQLERWAALQ